MQVQIGRHQVVASEVLAAYWHLAAERQRVYYARLAGATGPWTDDPVISRYRFTNAYRAADRVSQDLIRMSYEGSQSPEDLTLRVLLYRFFNKPSTWRVLEGNFGEIAVNTYDVDRYTSALERELLQGERIYSAAYIVPPPPFGAARKHRNHLLLIQHMLDSGLPGELAAATSLQQAFESILSYPSLGPFLAYQLAIDFNYTDLLSFDEDDFVVPGPGALSGIAKCFPGLSEVSSADVVRWMVDTQEEQIATYGIEFSNLFGRRLKLIDCQNLFCEIDKYARVMHPDVSGIGNRTRIKQHFVPGGLPAAPFFPPKWGLDVRLGAPVGPLSA